MDLLQAEATADLIDAGAPAQRRRALQQLDRGLSQRLDALRGEILELEALLAYEIDFPEEDEGPVRPERSEEHTSELQSPFLISYAVFCLKKKKKTKSINIIDNITYILNKQ